MDDLQKIRASSSAALKDMQESHSSLRKKFGKFRGQSQPMRTEHQEKYKRGDFDPIKAKKLVKPPARVVPPSKKTSSRKTKKDIDSELAAPRITAEAEKENLTNRADNNAVEEAQTVSTGTTSSSLCGHSHQDMSHASDDDFVQDQDQDKLITAEANNTSYEEAAKRRKKRMSETMEKYIQWPIEEHVPHHEPLSHPLLYDPNTALKPSEWQSVAKEEMLAAAQLYTHRVRGSISPDVYERERSNNTPRFFAWGGEDEADTEIEKRVLKYENAHSEYRDSYTGKNPLSMTRRCPPPKDHDILTADTTDERQWCSTSHLEMEASEKALEDKAADDDRVIPAGLSSETLAVKHAGDTHADVGGDDKSAPVFFAWVDDKPSHQLTNEELEICHKNVHTESRDSYTAPPRSIEPSKRVPPPADHDILCGDTEVFSPIQYQSVAQEQMEEANRAQSAESSQYISGSTSDFLKKDYRKSYAPGYFAWPVPQQFAETTEESKQNVHTEYRDSFVGYSGQNSSASAKVAPPADHDVFGASNGSSGNEEDDVWKSTSMQMSTKKDGTAQTAVAGASSAFLAKDFDNPVPPGYFAWPVVPQAARRSSGSKDNVHSEYRDNFVETSQQARQKVSPPRNNDIFAATGDEEAPEWKTEASSQMEAAHDCPLDRSMSSSAAGRDCRSSHAPDYFAWPVKEQKAVRSAESRQNVHTEYRDSFVQGSSPSQTVRAGAPEDRIVIGESLEDSNPVKWKSTYQEQGEDIEKRSPSETDIETTSPMRHESSSSAPNFFVWPKQDDHSCSHVSKLPQREYGYGGGICSEYDSQFVEMDVASAHSPPVRITQTIPKNEVDASVWKSTTQLAMENSLSSGPPTPPHPLVFDDRDRPMNFAWAPVTIRPLVERKPPKKQFLTTEHRTNFIDWSDKAREVNEHHLNEDVSSANTATARKRRNIKFSGSSETKSSYKAWSPIKSKKTNPPPVVASEDTKEESGSTQSRSSTSTSKREDRIERGDGLNSTGFSKDSLDQHSTTSSHLKSTASSMSSGRKWLPIDDLQARKHVTRLGLRDDINATTQRPRCMSAPTRRRPQHSHQDLQRINPILRNSRYPSATAPVSGRWKTETSSKYTWK